MVFLFVFFKYLHKIKVAYFFFVLQNKWITLENRQAKGNASALRLLSIGCIQTLKLTDGCLSQSESDVLLRGRRCSAPFFFTFPSISDALHNRQPFNPDNMATAAGRYYSEDGRATKRQKTDGMATVSGSVH